MFAGERRTLKPGQLITGRKQIAQHFKIDESKVQRILKKLESEHQIEQQTSNKNRLITVCNWATYQQSEQQNEQQLNNNCTTTEQQASTNKKVKNEKEVEEGKEVDKEPPLNHLEIIAAWNSLGLTQIKKLTTKRVASTKARIKEYSYEDFIKAIHLIKESSFLQGNNDRGWQISYDWFIGPNNFAKVLEGNYTDKVTPKLNSNLPKKIQLQNAMYEHGDLYEDIEELERRYIDNKLKEMNKAQ